MRENFSNVILCGRGKVQIERQSVPGRCAYQHETDRVLAEYVARYRGSGV